MTVSAWKGSRAFYEQVENDRIRQKVLPTIGMLVAPFGPRNFSQAIMHTVTLAPLEIANAATRAATVQREADERAAEVARLMRESPAGGMVSYESATADGIKMRAAIVAGVDTAKR